MGTISETIGLYIAPKTKKTGSKKPPEKLRLAITAVFLKPTGMLESWQKSVILNHDAAGKAPREVNPDFKPAIYNATILYYLIFDSKKVRDLISAVIEKRVRGNEDWFTTIRERYNSQFAEFFCLGVIQENLHEIMEQIKSPTWNPLTDKLPSPFGEGSLHSIALLYDKAIPWPDYYARFKEASELFKQGKLNDAEKILNSLEREAVIRLPAAAALQRQIQGKMQEAESYFSYLQKISK